MKHMDRDRLTGTEYGVLVLAACTFVAILLGFLVGLIFFAPFVAGVIIGLRWLGVI